MAFLRRASRFVKGEKAVRLDLYVRVFSLQIPPASVPNGLQHVVVELERGKRSDRTLQHPYDATMWTGGSPLSVPVTLYKDPKKGTFQSKPFTLKLRSASGGDLLATYTLDAAQFANISGGASSTATRTLKLSAVKGKSKISDAKLSITVGCDFRSEPAGDGETSTVLTGTTVIMDQDLSGFDDLGDDFNESGDLPMMSEGDENDAAADEEGNEAFGELLNDVDSLLTPQKSASGAASAKDAGGGDAVAAGRDSETGSKAEGEAVLALDMHGRAEGAANAMPMSPATQLSTAVESAEDTIALLQALANDEPEKTLTVSNDTASTSIPTDGFSAADDGSGTGVSADNYALMAMSDETKNLMEGLRSDISDAITKRREDSEQQTLLLDELDAAKQLVEHLRDELMSSEDSKLRAERAATELLARSEQAEAQLVKTLETLDKEAVRFKGEIESAAVKTNNRIKELEQQKKDISDELKKAQDETASAQAQDTINEMKAAASERDAAKAAALETAKARATAAEAACEAREAAASKKAAENFKAELEATISKGKAGIEFDVASTASELDKLAAKQNEIDEMSKALKVSKARLLRAESDLSVANKEITELSAAASLASVKLSAATKEAKITAELSAARIKEFETEVARHGEELRDVREEAERATQQSHEESKLATAAAIKALDTINEMKAAASERDAASAAALETAKARAAAAEAACEARVAAASKAAENFKAELEAAAHLAHAKAEAQKESEVAATQALATVNDMELIASQRNAATSAAVEAADKRVQAAEEARKASDKTAADAVEKFKADLKAAVQAVQKEANEEIANAKAEAEIKVTEMQSTLSRKLAEVCVGTASVVTAEAKELNKVWRQRAADAEKRCAALEDRHTTFEAWKQEREEASFLTVRSGSAPSLATSPPLSDISTASGDDASWKLAARKATRSMKGVHRRLCVALESLGESGKTSVELARAASEEEIKNGIASPTTMERTANAVDELIELLVADVQRRTAEDSAIGSDLGESKSAEIDLNTSEGGPETTMKERLEMARRLVEFEAAVDAGKREVASMQQLLRRAREATEDAELATEETVVEVNTLKTQLLKANLEKSEAVTTLRTLHMAEVSELKNEVSRLGVCLQATEARLRKDAVAEDPTSTSGSASFDESYARQGINALKEKLAETSKTREVHESNLESMQRHSEQLRADVSGKVRCIICEEYIDLGDAKEHICASARAAEEIDPEVAAATAAAQAAAALAESQAAPTRSSSWALTAMKAKRDALFR
jgi:hypothetical protein